MLRPLFALSTLLALFADQTVAFAPPHLSAMQSPIISSQSTVSQVVSAPRTGVTQVSMQDLDVIALVAGQENYGLAIVSVGEALWSFLNAPSFSHAKVLVPAALAAAILGVVSGPMITSGDATTVGTGLWIATGVSVGLGASYIARLLAPFSPSPKEIAALGLLVSVAGFFSFSQNLVVDGFVTLPSLPTVELPSLPELNF
jgi:hypothetical protein